MPETNHSAKVFSLFLILSFLTPNFSPLLSGIGRPQHKNAFAETGQAVFPIMRNLLDCTEPENSPCRYSFRQAGQVKLMSSANPALPAADTAKTYLNFYLLIFPHKDLPLFISAKIVKFLHDKDGMI